TGSSNTSTRRASPRSPSASGGTAPRSRREPSSQSKSKSSRLRLKSKPTCNMMIGASLVSSIGDSLETATEEAPLHGIRASLGEYPAEVGMTDLGRLRDDLSAFAAAVGQSLTRWQSEA